MGPAIKRRWLALVVSGCLCAPAPAEYDVKAAFLYNVTKYVQWPPSTRQTFVIGVLGKDPFGLHLDEVMSGQSVQKKAIVIRTFARIEDVSGPDLLFVCFLGLHVSQKLAALLGGEIVCRSEYGKGSRFSPALEESA